MRVSNFTTIKAQVQKLIDSANKITGRDDKNLTNAHKALLAGYGSGDVDIDSLPRAEEEKF